ncbi:hypothetical protein [Azospirillum brasilense]|uniref:hypothetical protein n=1 Tax=Azospirillum brasilense TaxID=192 RepID=UPI001EDBDB1F|nr:hypothetical protein [Azospirillum brasilense]UKJ75333.1 hypothetical protein H1Q64_13805 [Azospirillum brasilense]
MPGIAAAPFMPNLNEGKWRYRKRRLEDDDGRVMLIERKGFPGHGQNEVCPLDQPWRISPMRQRDSDAARVADSND